MAVPVGDGAGPGSASARLLRAAMLCVLACAFFAGANAIAKAAQTVLPGPELHTTQVTAARFLFAFLVLAPYILRRGRNVYRTAIPFRHLQRVLLGFAGVTCIFISVRGMPLGDATAIAWSAPLFALVCAAWFLGERVGPARWAAAFLGFVGVIVVMRPTAAAFEPIGLVALLAAACTGAELATIRVLAVRDSTLTILALNNTIGAVVACVIAAPFLVWPSLPQAVALVGVGVVMVSGQAIFLRAVALVEASVIAPFYYVTIAWSAAIGAIAFGEAIGWPLIVGAGLIAAGGVFVTMRGSR